MFQNLASVFILSAMCSISLAEPGVHTLRVRFPGPSSDKVVLPVQQNTAPYPAAGFRPDPPFELPQPTYLPPAEPELTYGPPEEPDLTYGPPAEFYGPPAELELTYGPPSDNLELPELLYGTPDTTYQAPQGNEFQGFPSAAIVNAPLTSSGSQLTPPRPNKATNFRPISRPQTVSVLNRPPKPVSHLTLPSPKRVIVFRPRRQPIPSQDLYPKTHLTLPRVERVIEFRPRRFPPPPPPQQKPQQQTNFFSRPLPTSIFGNSNKKQTGRQLPSKIFSN